MKGVTMKVTLWQQFSSNHSANFEIVAEFVSVEVAQTAAAEVQKIMDEISREWRKGNPNIVSKYSFTWTWFDRTTKAKRLPQWLNGALEIRIEGNLVFIRNMGDTLDAQAPLPSLLQILGANVAYHGGDWKSNIVWHFKFNVADTDKATHLENTILNYLTMTDEEITNATDPFDMGVHWWEKNNAVLNRDDVAFQLSNVSMVSYPDTYENLQRFLKWLKANGANDIECRVTEKDIQI
jgi:hypothetical protein